MAATSPEMKGAARNPKEDSGRLGAATLVARFMIVLSKRFFKVLLP